MTNAALGRPTASFFFDAVVYLLGRLSGYHYYIGVDHNDVMDDALRLCGIDPETTEWELHGRDGLYRRVHFAWRNQCYGHCGSRLPMCAKGISGNRGEWSLTGEGVKKAKLLRPVFEGKIQLSAGPNLTAQWLAEGGTSKNGKPAKKGGFEKLRTRVIRHLNRAMRRSAEFGKVEDHVDNYFTALVERDGLRDRIEAGRSIAPSEICAWARRHAYSEIRNEGRKPVCRTMHGALTKKEIGDHDPSNWTVQIIPNSINHSERLGVSGYRLDVGDYGADSPDSTIEFVTDPHNLVDEIVTQRMMEQAEEGELEPDPHRMGTVLDLISSTILEGVDKEKDPEWHKRIAYDRYVLDMSVKEIAAARGLNYDTERNKITLALSRVRKAMENAREQGTFDDYLG